MPSNNRNIGRDYSIDIATSLGPLPLPPTVTSIDMKPKYKTINSNPINGVPAEVNIPDGWEGTIEFERNGPAFDAYFAALELAYYNGQNIQPGTANEIIQEFSGAITQFRWVNFSVRLDDPGQWKGDSLVNVKLHCFAATKIQVS